MISLPPPPTQAMPIIGTEDPSFIQSDPPAGQVPGQTPPYGLPQGPPAHQSPGPHASYHNTDINFRISELRRLGA